MPARAGERPFSRRGASPRTWSHLVGSSPAMLEVYKLVARCVRWAQYGADRGESGTGKELIARAVHLNSPRRDKPFIPVNCGHCLITCLSLKCSDMKGGVYGPWDPREDCLKLPTAAPCFLMRSGISVRRCRSNCCVMQEHEVRRVGEYLVGEGRRTHYCRDQPRPGCSG